ncbi:MAG: GNAT family N-acetyltransferase [Candidatus Pseudomonas phytovorans]|uniref:GNAT family N-acetyltransferase n=1 Tax=Candidatus Pseudomonas phytovorans TaxID=3121377 RepID=A0AAJ6BE25_9PSED|nr:GNAT family N-acetyltransferase [Pseudomonas sp.]WEK32782.1 MAG: GNAT family N-acetyltransferase [Pseudomonas sp.]
MVISQANLQDFEVLVELASRLNEECGHFERVKLSAINSSVRRCLSDSSKVVLVIREPVRVVGFAVVSEVGSLCSGSNGLISELYILPERRGDGLAKALLSAVNEYAINRQWRCVEIGSPTRFPVESYVFYLRNGFDEINPRLRRVLFHV